MEYCEWGAPLEVQFGQESLLRGKSASLNLASRELIWTTLVFIPKILSHWKFSILTFSLSLDMQINVVIHIFPKTVFKTTFMHK